MIVVDASIVIEVLLRTPRGISAEPRLFNSVKPVCAPHLLDVEVAHVLRRLGRIGDVDDQRGREALQDLADMPIERFDHGLVLSRVWQLRNNLTAYDATYVALAELLGASLVTCDKRLAAALNHSIKIEVIS